MNETVTTRVSIPSPPPKPTIAERIQQVRLVRRKIKEIEARHKVELEPFEKLQDMLKGIILKYLHDTDQKATKTEFGSAAWYVRRFFSVENQDELRRHVIGTEDWGLISWSKVLSGPIKEFEEHHKALPPGVKDYKEEILSITAPPKSKLKTATSEGESNQEPEEVESI